VLTAQNHNKLESSPLNRIQVDGEKTGGFIYSFLYTEIASAILVSELDSSYKAIDGSIQNQVVLYTTVGQFGIIIASNYPCLLAYPERLVP
jgi:hypothetical protein